MTTKRTWRAISAVLLAAVVLGGATIGWAEYGAVIPRHGLKGLKGFYVQVDSLPFDVEQRGLTKQEVQRDIELQLRKGGALVLSREQAQDSPNAPRLHVRILTMKIHNAPLYAYCIVANFSQAAALARDGGITVDAVTWNKTGVGTIKTKEVDGMRKILSEIADEFLNAYLAENPRG